MTRPSFIMSKGEIARTEGLVETEDILLHYAEVYATRFQWTGCPKDMPNGFIEKALFWMGGVAPVKAFGENQLLCASRSLLGIYGQPVKWMPFPSGGSIIPSDIMRAYDQEDAPMLFCVPMKERIEELCTVMARAYNCLNQTLTSMQQPVVLQGAVGGEINIRETSNDLRFGKLFIPTLDKTGMQANVLDLGGKDHTQNLISTINSLDCEILARMGIKSAGTEKASGVTSEETLSITQELQLINQYDYEIRKKWSELPQIREWFPTIEVMPAPGLNVMIYDPDQGTQVRSEGDDGDFDRQGRPVEEGHAADGEDAQ